MRKICKSSLYIGCWFYAVYDTYNKCAHNLTTRDESMTQFNSCCQWRIRFPDRAQLRRSISAPTITGASHVYRPVVHAWLISGIAARLARMRSRSPRRASTFKERAMHRDCQPRPGLPWSSTAQKFTDLLRDDISWWITSAATSEFRVRRLVRGTNQITELLRV
jgi:hypothetical protein